MNLEKVRQTPVWQPIQSSDLFHPNTFFDYSVFDYSVVIFFKNAPAIINSDKKTTIPKQIINPIK